MDAEWLPVQVEGRRASQEETIEQLELQEHGRSSVEHTTEN